MAIIKCPVTGEVICTTFKLKDGSDSRYLTEFTESDYIGDGRQGVVVACQNNIDGRLYAIKKVSLKHAKIPWAEISREVEILSSLKHPAIIRYHLDWLETSVSGYRPESWNGKEMPCLYILMERYNIGLDYYLGNHSTRWSRAKNLSIFRQIVEGVAYLHNEMDLVHGNLCSENIFLDFDEKAKIGNFSLAKRPDGRVTKKDDIYDLGLIYAELLHSFVDKSERNDVFNQLKHEEFPEWWKEEEKDLVGWMMSKNRLGRPCASEIFAHDLFFCCR